MKRLVYLSYAVALVFCSSDAFAQSRFAASSYPQGGQKEQAAQPTAAFPEYARIGYVDIDRVAALSAEGKAVAAKLNDLHAKKSGEVAARGKEVEALQAKLSQGETVLNDVARARLQREFQRAQIDFERFSEDAQAELQYAQQQAVLAFNAQLFPVIQQTATEKNLWAVFGNESGLIWHNPALDLTEEIAKRLDAAAPKR